MVVGIRPSCIRQKCVSGYLSRYFLPTSSHRFLPSGTTTNAQQPSPAPSPSPVHPTPHPTHPTYLPTHPLLRSVGFPHGARGPMAKPPDGVQRKKANAKKAKQSNRMGVVVSSRLVSPPTHARTHARQYLPHLPLRTYIHACMHGEQDEKRYAEGEHRVHTYISRYTSVWYVHAVTLNGDCPLPACANEMDART